ncbi:AraC family transcriptional regulator [Duganella sp. BJB488]|uniref:AraC family transcriptional regulator n=1 Tax=unclassified Duganella TaxID=2636909 RepID=UPI000E355A36|nr:MULTISPECIES: helix-turn-helix transcriptional regulator [unclassified Duganella]RFP24121.1 AraC family transcriptional regulator [Duganella sp. BJB489]RFP27014.1 AraC family transcriptional regulator [Duganella sp. BJB488]RFP34786.1 AraC family transcriptional regulator [Duganella sp. BJB480]
MCRMQAKPSPLIDPARADADGGPLLFAALSGGDMRHTPTHSHARGQAIGALSGLLTIGTERERLVVPPGYAIWMPPHHPHGLDAHGPTSGWSVYVAPDACAALPALPQVFQVSGLLREAVLRASAWPQAPAPAAAQERIVAVVLDELAAAAREQLVLTMPTDRRALKIALALAADPADARSLNEWADWAAIAPRTLTRRFAEETGLSFTDWRQRARLMRAVELLAAGQAVTAVALELGYDSLSAFIAMFRREMGVAPGGFAAAHAAALALP